MHQLIYLIIGDDHDLDENTLQAHIDDHELAAITENFFIVQSGGDVSKSEDEATCSSSLTGGDPHSDVEDEVKISAPPDSPPPPRRYVFSLCVHNARRPTSFLRASRRIQNATTEKLAQKIKQDTLAKEAAAKESVQSPPPVPVCFSDK